MWTTRVLRTVQPESAVLAKGSEQLEHLWASNVIGPRGVFDAANRVNGVFGQGTGTTSGASWARDSSGAFIRLDDTGTGDANSKIITVGNNAGSGGPAGNVFTILLKFRIANTAVDTQILYGDPGAPANTDLCIQILAPGKVNVYRGWYGSFLTSNATLSSGVDYSIAVTHNGITLSLYIDGVLDTSAASGVTFAPNGQYQLSGIAVSNGSRIYYAAVANVTSIGLVQKVVQNPWQLFNDLIFTRPIGAAAIVPPTLLTAYADQITTSSARPNVTFTRP